MNIKTITILSLVFATSGAMAQTSVPNEFTSDTPALAEQVNANFAALASATDALEARLNTLENTSAPIGEPSPAFPGPNNRTVQDVDCANDSDALVNALESGSAYTTYNISGICDGPILINQDGIALIGQGDGAGIFLPPGLPTQDVNLDIGFPDQIGALFIISSDEIIIENITVDASNYTGQEFLGTVFQGAFAAAVLVTNGRAVMKDLTTIGGTLGLAPFRGVELVLKGAVNITEFANSGLSINDNVSVVADGDSSLNIATTLAGGVFIDGIDAVNFVNVDIRGNLNVELPLVDAATAFFISTGSNVRIRDNGTAAVQSNTGPFVIEGGAFRMDTGTMTGGMFITQLNSIGVLNNMTLSGFTAVSDGGAVSLNNATLNDSMNISGNSSVNAQSSTIEGDVVLNVNSSLSASDSDIGPVSSFIASVVNLNGGSIAGAEFHSASFAFMAGDISIEGDIALFPPTDIQIFNGNGGTSSLNGNTLYLCGSDESAVNDVENTGTVTSACRP